RGARAVDVQLSHSIRRQSTDGRTSEAKTEVVPGVSCPKSKAPQASCADSAHAPGRPSLPRLPKGTQKKNRPRCQRGRLSQESPARQLNAIRLEGHPPFHSHQSVQTDTIGEIQNTREREDCER